MVCRAEIIVLCNDVFRFSPQSVAVQCEVTKTPGLTRGQQVNALAMQVRLVKVEGENGYHRVVL